MRPVASVPRSAWTNNLIYGGSLSAIFAIAANKYNFEVAAATIGSLVVGFLNVFALASAIILLLKRRPVSRKQLSLSACALFGSVALIVWGYWLPLALVTTCLLFLDLSVRCFR